MAGDDYSSERKLELGKFFTDKHKKALFQALEKVKAELMILGFISLILTFTQYYIADICIPVDVANTMLPCALKDKAEKEGKGARRLLLWYEHSRSLAGDSKSGCKDKNKVPIITVKGLHQLHILIFFLAVLHVAYGAITMALGRLKTRGWKQWEEETSSHDFEFSNDPSRFRLTHETSFVRVHTSFWTRVPIFFYIMGSNMKKSIFDKQTARALQNWQMAVKRKHEGKGGNSPNRSVGNSPTASPVHSTPSSPFYPTTAATFHRSKTTGQPTHFAAYEDTNASDFKAEPLSHESSTRHLTDQTIACRNDHEIKLDLLTQPEVETRKQDLGRH